MIPQPIFIESGNTRAGRGEQIIPLGDSIESGNYKTRRVGRKSDSLDHSVEKGG